MRTILVLAALVGLLASGTAYAQRGSKPAQEADPEKRLATLEKQLKSKPNDVTLHYHKAKCLAALGRHDEGYREALQVMKLLIARNQSLAWLMLESVDLKKVRVDVHVNMGPAERTPPEQGIMRPLSFRVWAKEPAPRLLQVIDYEIGLHDGKPNTAALGMMMPNGGHGNFGMLELTAKYSEIRKKALELIEKQNP